MIVKEPYASRALQLRDTSKTIAEVNKYIILDYAHIRESERVKFKPFTDGVTTLNQVILYGGSGSEKEVTPFNHPLISHNNNWIALDLRTMVTASSVGEGFEIRNESEYRFALVRFGLSGLWCTGQQTKLYNFSLAHYTFSSWLSDNLTSKFGLDISDKYKLLILSAIYYSRLFTDTPVEDEVDKLIIRLKEYGVVPELIREVYSKLDKLDTIEDYCSNCYTVTDNLRLKNLDYTVLTNVVSTNWIGLNGKEISLLALEHPPTWISMVYASLTYKSFKRNHVTSIVEKESKRGKGDNFLKQLHPVISDVMVNGNV